MRGAIIDRPAEGHTHTGSEALRAALKLPCNLPEAIAMHTQPLCFRQLLQTVGPSIPVYVVVGDSDAGRPAAAGFIFSRAAPPQQAESALRAAHTALAIRIQPRVQP